MPAPIFAASAAAATSATTDPDIAPASPSTPATRTVTAATSVATASTTGAAIDSPADTANATHSTRSAHTTQAATDAVQPGLPKPATVRHHLGGYGQLYQRGGPMLPAGELSGTPMGVLVRALRVLWTAKEML